MNIKFLSSLLLSSSTFNLIEGHGYLKSPRSRNFYAYQEGVWSSVSGVPSKEFEPQSINRKQENQVCGSRRQNYDNYKDSRGNPMPWIPQAVYNEGDEIDIEFTLTANHWGHVEIYVCPNGDASTQDCFLKNPATMVQDLKYNGPRDHQFPQRGYIGSPNTETFRFKYQLPPGVTGNQVMMQWRYVTANSCLPPGYRNNSDLVKRGWAMTQLSDCNLPLNWTGQGLPEQYFNCAEIQINKSGGSCGNGRPGNGRCSSGECCSKWGWCGTSPAHCHNTAPILDDGEGGEPCGSGSRGDGTCPSGECCSKWGWCGWSVDHCN